MCSTGRRRPVIKTSRPRPQRGRRGSTETPAARPTREEHCCFCSGDAHPTTACPATAAKCHHCGNKGHFAKACLKKGPTSAERKVDVSAGNQKTGEPFVGAVSANGKARFVQVRINSGPILAKVGSGVEVPVLPSFPGLPARIARADVVLQGAGRSKLNVPGKFAAEID